MRRLVGAVALVVLGFLVGCGDNAPLAQFCAADSDCGSGYICECAGKDAPCTRACQYAPDAPRPKRCTSYARYGMEVPVCGDPCSADGDCATGCCYPTTEGGACLEAFLCEHARLNGH